MAEITTSTMVITPSIAQEMLSRNTRNRKVKNLVVERYASDMLSGLWKRNGETIKIAYDGTILDGQHRLLAVVKSGVPLVTEVTVGLDKDSIYTIDCGSSRSAADSLKIEGVKNYSQASTISTALLSTASTNSAKPYFSRAGNYVKPSVAAVVSYFNDNSDDVESVTRAIMSTGASRIMSVATAALIYIAGSYVSSDDAEYFISKMANGDGLSKGDPILETRNVLIIDKASKSRKLTFGVKNALIIKAWNKFIAGETIKQAHFRSGGSSREQFPEMIDYDFQNIDYRKALPTNGLTF